MKQLTIMRHAKSSWSDPHVDDVNRPLNDRGWKSARRMGRELERRDTRFDLIVGSPAVRVRETIEGLREELGLHAEVRFDPGIYLATAEDLLEIVHELPERSRAPLLVGHNPGLQQLVLGLTRVDDFGRRERVAQKFPTAAIAVVELPADRWARVKLGSGRIVELLLAKEIA